MKKRLLLIVFGVAACAAPENSASRNVESGTYKWTDSGGGCTTLVIGAKPTYEWDEFCDGTIDYTAQKVTFFGNTLKADGATVQVTKFSSTQFSGPFTLFENSDTATFIKQ